MVGFDGVGDDGEADLVDGAMPAGSGVVTGEFDGLVDFRVGEGFVLALVPSEAAGDAEILGNFLLGVEAHAVFKRAVFFVEGDGGDGDSVLRGVRAIEEVVDGFAVGAHVGIVGVEEDARGAFGLGSVSWGYPAMAQLELAILAVSAAEGPVEIDAVGDDGHGEDAVSQTPYAVVIFGEAAEGVAARVGGVVPCTVVVHGPVHELKVGVGGDFVGIDEVIRAHFADAKFKAADGNAGGDGVGARVLGGGLGGEADDLMDLVAGGVGNATEGGVAHDVEVGETGEPVCFAEAAAFGGFEVEDEVGCVADGTVGTPGGIDGADHGGFVFATADETVFALVGRMKRQVALGNDVGLSGEPPGLVIGMRGHRDDGGVAGLLGVGTCIGGLGAEGVLKEGMGEGGNAWSVDGEQQWLGLWGAGERSGRRIGGLGSSDGSQRQREGESAGAAEISKANHQSCPWLNGRGRMNLLLYPLPVCTIPGVGRVKREGICDVAT